MILTNILITVGILVIIIFGLVMGTLGCAAIFAIFAMIGSWLKSAFLVIAGRPTWR